MKMIIFLGEKNYLSKYYIENSFISFWDKANQRAVNTSYGSPRQHIHPLFDFTCNFLAEDRIKSWKFTEPEPEC